MRRDTWPRRKPALFSLDPRNIMGCSPSTSHSLRMMMMMNTPERRGKRKEDVFDPRWTTPKLTSNVKMNSKQNRWKGIFVKRIESRLLDRKINWRTLFFLFIFLYQLFPVIFHTYAQIFLSLSRRISEFFSTFHKITRFRSDSDIFIRTLLYDVHLLLSLTVLSIFFYINLLLTINSVDELELRCVVLFLNFRVYPSRGLFW